MDNLYYLHFRTSVSSQILDALSAEGASIMPVFETSYYIATSLSFSAIKHIIKSSPLVTQCNLVKVKGNSQFFTVSE